jgi:murein hydrolase activator
MRLAAILIWLAMPLAAQDSAGDALAQMRAANAQLAAAASADDQIAALTAAVQAYETGMTALRAQLRAITAREAEQTAALAQRQERLARLLMVLSDIGQSPQPVMLANPTGAIGAVRAGMIIGDLTPALRAEVAVLRADLDGLRQLRLQRDQAITSLDDGLRAVQTARTDLGRAISERRDVPRRFDEDQVLTALLLAGSATLADLVDNLATIPPLETDATITPLVAAANLPLPVAGLVRTAGVGRAGIVIATAPRALVTAPVQATILFQGPLLDYGNVVILEPAADVLFIFAGLAEIFGKVGEVVLAQAPIGLMGGDPTTDDTNLTDIGAVEAGQTAQQLYVEVRQGQTAVNPDAWFALE